MFQDILWISVQSGTCVATFWSFALDFALYTGRFSWAMWDSLCRYTYTSVPYLNKRDQCENSTRRMLATYPSTLEILISPRKYLAYNLERGRPYPSPCIGRVSADKPAPQDPPPGTSTYNFHFPIFFLNKYFSISYLWRRGVHVVEDLFYRFPFDSTSYVRYLDCDVILCLEYPAPNVGKFSHVFSLSIFTCSSHRVLN